MKFSTLSLLGLQAASPCIALPSPASRDPVIAKATAKIDILACSARKDPESSQGVSIPLIPTAGAKSRFDDFVQALREECGYRGTQPYWDWAKTAQTGLSASPIFDGSATSMSGNGVHIPNQADIVLGGGEGSGLPPVYLPAGTGGGCVTSGPFINMTVNLGPIQLDVPGGGPQDINPAGPFAYNPRCLRRDLTDAINQRYSNASSIKHLVAQETIDSFQMIMQGIPGTGDIGVHGGGHYSLGGDPGRDVSVSPGDPAFYLHHAMIDRVWWMWQMVDAEKRVYGQKTGEAVGGTRTFLNIPESESTMLDNVVDFGCAAGPKRKLRELMSVVEGPFCYVYV
ncbi:hypothetical protein SMACR_09195 [Sordaria macrospora]|uniref:WGS project CABT00000000 data, contig 2.76 n=2 Tax=Sordaria macrospora TaxID=5147 RepID=F7WBH3_SORMK|nr:uncharacterized protein SMAC_09195 [Sordaria macrospora k-hell]KAA8635559.1 hypothetical protein SMACR_09195 [Sordaria macrospora]WPJ66303.1 hypothetical protein SMAC4_09195 [Sordaria macrospora]CCC14414.1 unnamed protein product [Sordaria macrospora k-hell]